MSESHTVRGARVVLDKGITGENPKLAVRNKFPVDDDLYATVPTFDAS